MNLERVYADSRADHHHKHLIDADKSTVLSSKQSDPNHDRLISNPLVDRILNKICAKKLLGKEYVSAYLHDQLRRNCRPNTIRSNGANITAFLTYLKNCGIDRLQFLISR